MAITNKNKPKRKRIHPKRERPEFKTNIYFVECLREVLGKSSLYSTRNSMASEQMQQLNKRIAK